MLSEVLEPPVCEKDQGGRELVRGNDGNRRLRGGADLEGVVAVGSLKDQFVHEELP